MKALYSVSNGLKRYANKRYILPLVFLLIAILVLMERGPFGSGKLKALSGGLGMLDMMFGYSAELAYGMLERIGVLGRQLYTRLLGLDFLFAAVYMALQSLLLTALMKKANLGGRWQALNLLPFLRSALDVAENCLLLYVIAAFPARHGAAVSVASAVTVVKLALNYGYIAIVFILGALTMRRTFSVRRKRKPDEMGCVE